MFNNRNLVASVHLSLRFSFSLIPKVMFKLINCIALKQRINGDKVRYLTLWR